MIVSALVLQCISMEIPRRKMSSAVMISKHYLLRSETNNAIGIHPDSCVNTGLHSSRKPTHTCVLFDITSKLHLKKYFFSIKFLKIKIDQVPFFEKSRAPLP